MTARTAPSASQQLNDLTRMVLELHRDVRAILAKLDTESPATAASNATGANRALLDRNARRARGDACPTCDDVGLVVGDQDVASPCPTCKGRP